MDQQGWGRSRHAGSTETVPDNDPAGSVGHSEPLDEPKKEPEKRTQAFAHRRCDGSWTQTVMGTPVRNPRRATG